MKILIAGSGAIGTVYGTQLAKHGHSVDVLAHGVRTEQIQRTGLLTADVISGVTDDVSVSVVSGDSEELYDLVLISVKVDQIDSVCANLRQISGAPDFLFFGNNPAGRRGLPDDLPGSIHLGFPGVGGELQGDRVAYMRIPGQPTTLEKGNGAYLKEFSTILKAAGFPVAQTSDIDGWLAYHGVFIGAVSSALYRCGCNATALAANRDLLTLMCRSIEEGFRALEHEGIRGLPRNLRILHQPALRTFAVWYWARAMKSPVGEHCFAAHCRHAEPEMQSLAQDALQRFEHTERTENLRLLFGRGEVGFDSPPTIPRGPEEATVTDETKATKGSESDPPASTNSARRVPTDSVADIDHIVGHWTDLRREGVERQVEAEAERHQFLENFRAITDSVIRPAMQAAVDRLGKDGGGGLIEERGEAPMHRPRIILWMSLDGNIAGTPRQDLNPYLQLDADVGRRRIDVWEGDMWEKEGASRATSPLELGDVSTESVTTRILDILRRAATHGVPA